MGIYHLDLDRLSEHTKTSVEELKKLSYEKLELMMKDMEHAKFVERNNRNAKDEEYERLILKFFTPVPFLRHWFTDHEIVLACARTGVTDRDICQEFLVQPGQKPFYNDAEYLRTSTEYVPQFDRQGRELAERERKVMDVYRVRNRYAGLSHGKVILELLYGRYPELEAFGFKAYEMSGSDYEIYPKNGIYTSFTALMSGNVDAIIFRNRKYSAWFNNGRYSVKECEEAFHTEEAQEMFDMIRRIGENEASMGHAYDDVDDSGKIEGADGLVETHRSASGSFWLIREPEEKRKHNPGQKHRLRIGFGEPCLVGQFIDELLESNIPPVTEVRVCHVSDYLEEHAVVMTAGNHRAYGDGWRDVSHLAVCAANGWTGPGESVLVLRVDHPQLMKRK